MLSAFILEELVSGPLPLRHKSSLSFNQDLPVPSSPVTYPSLLFSPPDLSIVSLRKAFPNAGSKLLGFLKKHEKRPDLEKRLARYSFAAVKREDQLLRLRHATTTHHDLAELARVNSLHICLTQFDRSFATTSWWLSARRAIVDQFGLQLADDALVTHQDARKVWRKAATSVGDDRRLFTSREYSYRVLKNVIERLDGGSTVEEIKAHTGITLTSVVRSSTHFVPIFAKMLEHIPLPIVDENEYERPHSPLAEVPSNMVLLSSSLPLPRRGRLPRSPTPTSERLPLPPRALSSPPRTLLVSEMVDPANALGLTGLNDAAELEIVEDDGDEEFEDVDDPVEVIVASPESMPRAWGASSLGLSAIPEEFEEDEDEFEASAPILSSPTTPSGAQTSSAIRMQRVTEHLELILWNGHLVALRDGNALEKLGLKCDGIKVMKKECRPTVSRKSSVSSLPSLTYSASTASLSSVVPLTAEASLILPSPTVTLINRKPLAASPPHFPVSFSSFFNEPPCAPATIAVQLVTKAEKAAAAVTTELYTEHGIAFSYPCGSSIAQKKARILTRRREDALEVLKLKTPETRSRWHREQAFTPLSRRHRATTLPHHQSTSVPTSPILRASEPSVVIDEEVDDTDIPFTSAAKLQAFRNADPLWTKEWEARREAKQLQAAVSREETHKATGVLGLARSFF